MSIVSDLDLPTCYFAGPDGRYHQQLAETRQPVLRR